MFADVQRAGNLSFYVHPQCRGGDTAIKLLHIYHDWARACGAENIDVIVTSGLRLGQTDKLLTRLGFRQMGGNYRLAVRDNFVEGQ